MPIQFSNGKILFTDNGIAFNENCCCGEVCTNCTSTPLQLSVVFGGTWAGSCTSGTCSNLSNGGTPYVLDQVGAGGAACNFLHTLASIECASPDEIARVEGVFYFSGGNYRLRITLEGDQSHVISWDYSFGASKPNCTNEDGLDTGLLVPFLSDSGTACDGSSVTCTVTAL
jgi:hypothetical protein